MPPLRSRSALSFLKIPTIVLGSTGLIFWTLTWTVDDSNEEATRKGLLLRREARKQEAEMRSAFEQERLDQQQARQEGGARFVVRPDRSGGGV